MLCRALVFSTVVDTSLLQGYPLDCQDSEELGKNTSNGEAIRAYHYYVKPDLECLHLDDELKNNSLCSRMAPCGNNA